MKDLTKAAIPFELVVKGGDPNKTVLWVCGKCNVSARSREEAVSCCAPYICDECGKQVNSYCTACSDKKQAAKEQALYDKATKVTYSTYRGEMLRCDHCSEYFWDLDAYLDAHQDDADMPTWVWGTYKTALVLDAEEIVSQALESQEFYEEAFDNVPKAALDDLQAFLDGWLTKVTLNSYMVDYGVVVDLTEEVEGFLEERYAEGEDDEESNEETETSAAGSVVETPGKESSGSGTA